MAWFSRFTRFGDAHMVFGQEQDNSCGIASVIMCVFKINKLNPLTTSVQKNTDIYDAYSKVSGSTYKPATQGTDPALLATVLNKLNCGNWVGKYTDAKTVSKIIWEQVGKTAGFGPTVSSSPVIAGVGWKSGGGHAVVVDTIRLMGFANYCTICDPWDANVHIVPIDKSKPFAYNAGNGGFTVDFGGTHKGQTKPFAANSPSKGIAIVYRT